MSANPAFSPVDQAVRDRIRTEIDRSLCVEAGAGTGKTTVLVARIVETLRRGAADVDSIAVITFTEKAAAELSARVREGLEATLWAGVDDPAEEERLREAIAGLYRARIETIHAFATSLLHERPVEARLDPQFAVLDDVAGSLAFDHAYTAWLDERLKDDDASLERALTRGMPIEAVREAAAVLYRNRAALPLTVPAAPRPPLRAFVAYVAAAAADLEAIAAEATAEGDKGVAQIPRLVDFARQLADAAGDTAETERLVLMGMPSVKKDAGRQESFSDADLCRTMKAHFARFRDDGEALREALRAEALVGLLPGLQEFVATFEARRRADGQADFDDLLLWARGLLRDDRDVRAYFQRRYGRLLVDEFQDTDPVQAEICAYLTSEEGSDAEDWRDLPIAAGKLFVVGDPKQSIYRFRQADIAIYDDVKARLLGDGQQTITQNFRSLPGVIDWVNALFDRVFEPQPGLQPANVALVSKPNEPPVGRPSVTVLHGTLPPADGKPSAEDVRAEEGRLLAAQLAAAHGAWLVRDNDASSGTRPAAWRDMVVLMPRRTGVEALEDELDTLAIPHRREGGRSFFDQPEVRELIALLRALDDPTDAVSLYGALRSSACACSDEEIFLWIAGDGHRRLDYRVVPDDAAGPVADSLRMLADLHRRRRGLSLAELVRRVLAGTGIVEFWLGRDGRGPQAAANLLKVVDQARNFAASGGGALRPFVHWLETHRETLAEEAEAGISEESDDLVRLMTIHSAKGLEFPIVALAHLDGRGNDKLREVARPDEHVVEFRVGSQTRGTRFQTPGFDDACQAEKTALALEKRRLFYVAATRARDHLVIPAVPGPEHRTGLAADLLGAIPEWEEGATAGTEERGCFVEDTPALLARAAVVTPPAHAEPSAAELDAAAETLDAWSVARAATIKKAGAGLELTTASSVKPWDRARPLTAAAEDAERVAADWAPPLEAGIAVHRVMETVSLADGSGLDAAVTAACAEAGISGHEAAVRAIASDLLASDAVRRAVASDHWYREVPFTLPANGNGGADFSAGRMDLVFREPDGGWVVVDYKTGAVGDDLDAAAEEHRPQAAVYAAAIERVTGEAVREVVMVFTGGERSLTGEALSRPPDH